MAGQADGSIIIDTELRSDGFKAGSAELLAGIKALSNELKNLRADLTKIFSKSFSPEVDTGNAEKNIASLESRIRDLETELSGLKNSSATNDVGPQISFDGPTQKASDFQRQIDAVNSSVERLEPTFQKAMSGNESAMATFEGKASVLEAKIAELQERLDRIGQTECPTQEYEALCAEIDKTDQKFQSLLDRQEKMQALGVSDDSMQWKSLQYDMEQVSNRYHELIELKKQLEQSGGAVQMGADTSQYAQMEATLSGAKARLEEMRNATGQVNTELSTANSSTATMESNTGRAEERMRSLASASRSVAAFIGKAAKSALGTLVRGIKTAASHMARMVFHGKSMQGQFKGLISSAKKFTLSLLGARGIYALLRKAVSAYMAQNEELTNKLNACWSGIGNLLGPIITKLINLVAQAVAYVTSFLKLFGMFSSTATGAINNAGDAATGAIKELKRQLASFDELNVLSDNSSNNGSGNGNNDSSIELPEVTLPDWAKLLVEQLQAGDWAAAATTLANQLNSMIASVDWAGIGQKIGYYLNGALTFLATFIREFDWKALGSDLAILLNNIITSVDWGNLGELLVAKWAIILQLLVGFFEKIDGATISKGLYDLIMGAVNACDWVSLTGQLASNISKFIHDADFQKLGSALSTGIRTALQSLIAGIDNFDWEDLGKKLADFLNGIDWGGIFSDFSTLIGKLFISAFNLLKGFVDEIDWDGITEGIWNSLENVGAELNFGDESDSARPLLSIFQNIISSVQSLASALKSAWEENDNGVRLFTAIRDIVLDIVGLIDRLTGATADWLSNLDLGPLMTAFTGCTEALEPLVDLIGNVLSWYYETVLLPIAKWYIEEYATASINEFAAAIQALSAFLEPLLAGLQNLWTSLQPIIEWVESVVIVIVNGVKEAFSKLGEVFEEKGEKIQNIVTGIGEVISAVWTLIGPILILLRELVEDVFSFIGEIISSVVGFVIDLLSGLIDFVAGVFTGDWDRAWSGIKSIFVGIWDLIKDVVLSISSFLTNIFNTVKNNLESIWNGIKTFFINIWNGIKSAAIAIWNGIKSVAVSVWTAIKNAAVSIWTGLKNAVMSVVNELKTGITNAFNAVKTFLTNCMNTIKSTITSVWNGIWNGIKGVINGILGGIESMVNGVIKGLNYMINALNKLSFDVPDWVPVIGGKKFGFNIKNISEVSIPRLASGGILKKGQLFQAREKGPELVGKYGNKAGVMNNDQIVDSVSDGVEKAVERSNNRLANCLQAIASNVVYRQPKVVDSAIPYKTAAAIAGNNNTEISTALEASNDELINAIVQGLANQTEALISAIERIHPTTKFDKSEIAEAVIQEINRRTRMMNKSPLLG